MEEVDRAGTPAVLAADAELELGLALAPQPRAHAHELADAGRVERLERRAVEDLHLDVAGQDATLDVVAREPERSLRQVVGAERVEVGLVGDLVRAQAGPRQL